MCISWDPFTTISFSRRLRLFGKFTRIPPISDDSLFDYRDSKSMSSGMAVSDGFVFVSFAHKSLKINLNASKPSMNINIIEHPPSKGKKCQNVWVGTLAAIRTLHRS